MRWRTIETSIFRNLFCHSFLSEENTLFHFVIKLNFCQSWVFLSVQGLELDNYKDIKMRREALKYEEF